MASLGSCFGCFGDEHEDGLETNTNNRIFCGTGFIDFIVSKLRTLFGNRDEAQPLATEEPTILPITPKFVINDDDEEDDYDNSCPICFEAYTPDNPKMITKCSHHYHLGCIYDWMERSSLCPMCDRVLEVEELT